MKLKIACLLLLLAFTLPGWAGSRKKGRHKHKNKTEAAQPKVDDDDDTKESDDDEPFFVTEKDHMSLEDMRNSYSVDLPMNRNGSGTAWNTDKAPMYKYNIYTHKWLFMVHGDMFVRYSVQDAAHAGKLGSEEVNATNMIAITGHRKSGLDALFHFNAAFSTDALIAAGSGFAQLFQSANQWNGHTVGNRQHPNSIISELSVSYAYSFSDNGDIFVYGGYPAEPALGPVSYLKRPSGAFIPDAPLSHNWVDATNITYGVATLGLRIGKFKLEGSSFTGREPSKGIYNFSLPFFNSWSSRLSFNPSSHWALQVSRGYIVSPNALDAGVNVTRTTASANYVYSLGPRKYFSFTVLGGQNDASGHAASYAGLAEATLKINKWCGYTRYEWVQKTGAELNLSPGMYSLTQAYNINALTAGGSFDLFFLKYFSVALGAQATAHLADASLNALYGQYPVSGEVYLHFFPILQ